MITRSYLSPQQIYHKTPNTKFYQTQRIKQIKKIIIQNDRNS